MTANALIACISKFRPKETVDRLAAAVTTRGISYSRAVNAMGRHIRANGEARARDRAIIRVQKMRMRLGGSPNLLEPIPPKPPRMHWRTYRRLSARIIAADERSAALIVDDMALPGRSPRPPVR